MYEERRLFALGNYQDVIAAAGAARMDVCISSRPPAVSNYQDATCLTDRGREEKRAKKSESGARGLLNTWRLYFATSCVWSVKY